MSEVKGERVNVVQTVEDQVWSPGGAGMMAYRAGLLMRLRWHLYQRYTQMSAGEFTAAIDAINRALRMNVAEAERMGATFRRMAGVLDQPDVTAPGVSPVPDSVRNGGKP